MMSEELTGGNHTTEEVETIEQPIDQQQGQIEQPTQTQAETASPSAFTVKYNKEEMQIPYDQAPDYIQKGLNYDKVSGRVTEYENYLDRIARITGYENHAEMVKHLDEVEKQQEEQRYQELGIDKNTFNNLLEEHPDIQFARQVRAEKENEQRLASEGQELFSEFPNLKVEDISPEVWNLRETRGFSLLDSYLRVNFKSLSQQKEQEVIQKLQTNGMTSPGALGREGTEHKASYSQLSATEKADLRARVLRGENVEL